ENAHLWGTYPSPSGRFQIELVTPHETRIMDLHSGKALFDDPEHIWDKAAWGYDDQHLVFAINRGHGSISLYGGVMTPAISTFTLAEGSWELLSFATDPKQPRVAFATGPEITFYDLDSRNVVQQIPIGRLAGRQMAWSASDKLAYSAETCFPQPNKVTRTEVIPLRRVCVIDAPDMARQHGLAADGIEVIRFEGSVDRLEAYEKDIGRNMVFRL